MMGLKEKINQLKFTEIHIVLIQISFLLIDLGIIEKNLILMTGIL